MHSSVIGSSDTEQESFLGIAFNVFVDSSSGSSLLDVTLDASFDACWEALRGTAFERPRRFAISILLLLSSIIRWYILHVAESYMFIALLNVKSSSVGDE